MLNEPINLLETTEKLLIVDFKRKKGKYYVYFLIMYFKTRMLFIVLLC